MLDDMDIVDHESDSATWIAMADLMTGLMAIFLVLSMIVLVNQKEENKPSKIKKQDQARIILIQTIKDALDKANIQAAIDPVTGDVGIINQDLLFEEGSAVLSPQGRAFLNEFVPSYSRAIFSLSPEVYKEVVRIVVEGRTSSKGSAQSNMTLSLNRANAVTQHIYRMGRIPGYIQMIPRLTPVGRGEMQANQYFDDPNDRVVLFRFQFKGEFVERKQTATDFVQDMIATATY
jgi:outer membrane protein OmpA-like peptidoglycan-associated protein